MKIGWAISAVACGATLIGCSAFAPLEIADIDEGDHRICAVGMYGVAGDYDEYMDEMRGRGYLNGKDVRMIKRQQEYNVGKNMLTMGTIASPGMTKCGVEWNLGVTFDKDRFTTSRGTYETWWYGSSGSLRAVRFGPDGLVSSVSS